MKLNNKLIFNSLAFGVAVLIFGMIIFKIMRIIGTNFNNDILIGLLLIVSGALAYAAYDTLGMWGSAPISPDKKHVKFSDNIVIHDHT